LTLSRPLVAAGPVTIELRNGGEDPHDLVLEDDDAAEVGRFAELPPGGLVSQSVVLPAGTYQLFCSLPGHRAAGMKAMLKAG